MSYLPSSLLALMSAALICSCGCSPSPQPAPPTETAIAADHGLDYFATRLSARALGDLGFASQQELVVSDVRLPFRVHTISPQLLETYGPGDDVSDLIEETDLWLFPVVHAEEVRAMITVDRFRGQPTAVAIGGRRLAETLMQIRERWPSTEGYQLRYVRFAMADMVIVSHMGLEKITPLSTTALLLRLPARPDGLYGLYKPEEVLPRLLPIARYVVTNEQGG